MRRVSPKVVHGYAVRRSIATMPAAWADRMRAGDDAEGFTCPGCGILVSDDGEYCSECLSARAEYYHPD